MEQTLVIIKPDAYMAGHAGKIIDMFLERGFSLIAAKVLRFTNAEAERFYEVHRGKEFFVPLTAFMSSGPSLVMVLTKEDAIAGARSLMGVTDSTKAAPGTIRARFGENTRRNAVHGSDSSENARHEIAFFFSALEMLR